jgi:hypothetical protein
MLICVAKKQARVEDLYSKPWNTHQNTNQLHSLAPVYGSFPLPIFRTHTTVSGILTFQWWEYTPKGDVQTAFDVEVQLDGYSWYMPLHEVFDKLESECQGVSYFFNWQRPLYYQWQHWVTVWIILCTIWTFFFTLADVAPSDLSYLHLLYEWCNNKWQASFPGQFTLTDTSHLCSMHHARQQLLYLLWDLRKFKVMNIQHVVMR